MMDKPNFCNDIVAVLVENLEVEPVLECLLTSNVFPESTKREISEKGSRREQAQILTNVFLNDGSSQINIFLEALRRTHQDHLVTAIEERGLEKVMSLLHKETLHQIKIAFIGRVDNEVICENLHDVLTPNDIYDMKATDDGKEKNRRLIDRLSRKADGCFYILKKALDKAGYDDIAELLNIDAIDEQSFVIKNRIKCLAENRSEDWLSVHIILDKLFDQYSERKRKNTSGQDLAGDFAFEEMISNIKNQIQQITEDSMGEGTCTAGKLAEDLQYLHKDLEELQILLEEYANNSIERVIPKTVCQAGSVSTVTNADIEGYSRGGVMLDQLQAKKMVDTNSECTQTDNRMRSKATQTDQENFPKTLLRGLFGSLLPGVTLGVVLGVMMYMVYLKVSGSDAYIVTLESDFKHGTADFAKCQKQCQIQEDGSYKLVLENQNQKMKINQLEKEKQEFQEEADKVNKELAALQTSLEECKELAQALSIECKSQGIKHEHCNKEQSELQQHFYKLKQQQKDTEERSWKCYESKHRIDKDLERCYVEKKSEESKFTLFGLMTFGLICIAGCLVCCNRGMYGDQKITTRAITN